MTTLFEKIGGEKTINQIVDTFYNNVIADARINHFFVSMDMKKQADHQKFFLTYVFGGANEYIGQSMGNAHQKLVQDKGLNSKHFDAFVDNLEVSLQNLNINQEHIEEALQIIEKTRKEILS